MHLLAIPSALLDDNEAVVDLAQTPGDVVGLSFSDSDLSGWAKAWAAADVGAKTLRLASLRKLRHPMSVDLYIESMACQARLIVVRCLGGLDYWRYGFERLSEVARRRGILLAALPGDDRPDPRLTGLSTAPESAVALLDRYFREGGPENLGQAVRLMANLVGASFDLAPPKPLSPVLGMTVGGDVISADALAAQWSDRPAALVIGYRSSLIADDVKPIRALMEALDSEGLEPLAIAVTSLKDSEAALVIQRLIEARRPAVIVTATSFSARRDDDATVLDAADVPVLQVVLAGTQREAWELSPRGLGAADLAMNVALPELDGRIFTRAISFKAEAAAEPGLDHRFVVHEPAADRVVFVARLAANWARLGQTPRAQRKLALVLSDYPGRGGRAGYAVGLDAPESVREILALLGEAGYDTGAEDWRAAPDIMGRILGASCLRAGNVIVLVQPDRGSATDRKQGYHDGARPPCPEYVAVYRWLRESERIDALIHMGTHGTLEWLPGKALALSAECFPEAVLGPIPVIYPFIVNNPGEALQAKRRISAVTIGHLTPPLAEAGLHGGLAELEGLIEEYAEAEGSDRRRAALLESEIVERAERSGLARDCGVTSDDTPREAIAKLDAQLCDIKELAIRDGLHVFGRSPGAEDRAALAAAMTKAAGLGAEASGRIDRLAAQCGAFERAALLAALDGRRVAPGPSGAPTRGRLDVLPTGRNLTTVDPRAIPTRTAAVLGVRAADEVIRRHLQDRGEYPRSVVLDLWASATLRTGGDELAQALAYLGVRPVWDLGSNRVTGVEVIPLAKLDRPRIDVTLRVSGLFRDVFESQMTLFGMAVRLVAGLDEDAEWNPLAEARRREGAVERVFGGAPGVYGAGAASVALDQDWTSRDDIGAAYLAAVSHAYDQGGAGTPAAGRFRGRVAAADALIHPQDDRERDLLDADGAADFIGGFAAAAASLGGAPALYHLDASKPEAPVARTAAEEIARIVRGRITNPRWTRGMLSHGYRGVAEMAQSIDALYAFAAMSDAAPSHLFDAAHDALFGDEAVVEAMLAVNPAAAHAMADRLLDAIRRGMWTPRRNAVYAELSLSQGEREEKTII
jgi:cobaltochelatase CobN